MDCATARERLQDYLDGDLDGREADRFEAHAAECADCRRLLAAYRELIQAAERLPVPAPSAGLADRIMAAVEPARPAGRPKRRFRYRWLAAAAAAVLAVMVVLARRPVQPPPGPDLLPVPPFADLVATPLKAFGESMVGLAGRGQGPLDPVGAARTKAKGAVAGLYDVGKGLLATAPADLVAGVQLIGRSAASSFSFLVPGAASAPAVNGT